MPFLCRPASRRLQVIAKKTLCSVQQHYYSLDSCSLLLHSTRLLPHTAHPPLVTLLHCSVARTRISRINRKLSFASKDGCVNEGNGIRPSCPKCAPSWPNINSCAAACPVFSNFSMVYNDPLDLLFHRTPAYKNPVQQIIFNPGAFIDVIKCSCTDTFQAAFPQCVDW
jgi:hypothetical protein